MSVAEAVRTARRQAGLSQRELARRAGVPQSTVGRLESGTFRARADTVDKLLAAMQCEVVAQHRPGRGVDRTIIRRMLALSPRDRILYAVSSGKAIAALRDRAG
jgi:predicted transcriptional regulator